MAETEVPAVEVPSSDSIGAESEPTASAEAESAEDITYHAVERDGQVTAIWEMQGRKHLRTIDPRSRQGQEILRLYTSEHLEDASANQKAGGAS